MALTMLDAVDFTKIPALNLVVPVVAADPTGYEAGLIYNTTEKAIKYHNGTTWVALGPAGAGGPPTGAAGGDLTGSYPNPQIAAGVIVDADINASAAIQQSKIAGLSSSLSGKVDTTRTLTAGAGLTGGGDLSANRTFDIGAGAGITVAADSISLDTAFADTRYINTSGDTMTGPLVLAGNPVSANDAANKAYVDLFAQGFTFKNAVRVVATTDQVPLTGLKTIDGVSLNPGDRVLLAGQASGNENGIYNAQSTAWTRATDADALGEIQDGTLVPIAEGTTNGNSLWMCTDTAGSVWNPGTHNSVWTKFLTLADLNAGTGLTKSGTTINLVAGDSTLTVAADDVRVASAPKWTTARSITLTGDVTGTVASVDGSANVSIATTVVNAGKRYAADVGAGTSVVITHNLNTRDVDVAVYRTTTPWDRITCGIEHTSVNTVTLKFASAVTAAAYRCVVLA